MNDPLRRLSKPRDNKLSNIMTTSMAVVLAALIGAILFVSAIAKQDSINSENIYGERIGR